MGRTCLQCSKIKHLTRPCSACGRKAVKCGNTPNVISLKETEYVQWRYVKLPASYGTEEDYPLPKLKNAYLIYGANGHTYMYDAGGIANRMPDYNTPDIIADLTATLNQEIQDRTNGDATLTQDLNAEVTARINAVNAVASDLVTEIGNRESGDNTLAGLIDDEADARIAADTTLQDNIDDVTDLIPEQATISNQLADKAFVNSTVQTGTANYRGSYADWASVPTEASQYPTDYSGSTTPTVNDYMVVQDASDYTGTSLTGTWRFKYTSNWAADGKLGWLPEYQVNETPMTAAQLAALNSGITAIAVTKLTGLADIQTVGTGLALTSGTLTAAAMTGATSSTSGTAGSVPAPSAGDQNKFLAGDGTWKVADDGSNLSNQTAFWGQTVSNGVVNGDMTGPVSDEFTLNSGGSFGITFTTGTTPVSKFRVAPSTNYSYQALNMSNNQINGLADGAASADAATVGQMNTAIAAATPSVMTGATSSTAGSSGLVPAPAAGDEGKVLTGGATYLGVDATVTQNSSNLVTSGAVYSVVGDVESLLAAI